MFRRTPYIAAVIVLSCLLLACIDVEDFGEYWKKGFIDSCVNDIVMHSMTEESDEQDSQQYKDVQLRSIKIGKQLFLMFKNKAEDKGGSMIRYRIDGSDYISYRLDENKRTDFLKAHPNSPVVLSDETATLPLLNAESAKLLEEVANDDSYWVETGHEPYNPENRTDCVKQAK